MNILEIIKDFNFPTIPLPPRCKKSPPLGWRNKPESALYKWKPTNFKLHNYGIPCGYAYEDGYLMVLDVDPKNGGDQTLTKLQMLFESLPKTFTVRTGNGGYHHYFISKEPWKVVRYAGLDFQGLGQYVVGPGCTFELSTKKYIITEECEVADMPDWFFDVKPFAEKEKKDAKKNVELRKELIPNGQRHDYLWSLACTLKKRGYNDVQLFDELTRANAEDLEVPGDEKKIQGFIDGVNNTFKKSVSKASPQAPLPEYRDYFSGNEIINIPDEKVETLEETETIPVVVNNKFISVKHEQFHLMMTGSEKGPSKDSLATIVMSAFLGEEEGTIFVGKPKQNYLFSKSLEGITLIIEVDDNKNCIMRDSQWLKKQVKLFGWKSLDFRKKSYVFSDKAALDIALGIADNTNSFIPIGDIKTHAFKSDDCYTFNRSEIDPVRGSCPEFKSLLQRVSSEQQGRAMLAFIGSLFDPDHKIENILILHDVKGGGGKGSIRDVIKYALGTSYVEFSSKSKNLDKYWTTQLVTARLAGSSDIQNVNIIHNEDIMKISGGDPITIREMQKAPYTMNVNCAFLLTTNHKLNFKGEGPLERRLIHVTLSPRTGAVDPGVKKRMLKESPAIISMCMEYWKYVKSENNGIIDVDSKELEMLREENTAEFMDILLKVANFNSDGFAGNIDLWDKVAIHMPDIKRNHMLKADFKAWLVSLPEILLTRKNNYGKRTWVFSGISLRK